MNHDQLARSLAAHVRGAADRMVWTDMKMGPSGSVRPDVFALKRSFNIDATIYEVKVSMSDFRADVTAGKWLAYRQYAGRIYFAAPAGLLSKADVPQGCGLIIHDDAKGWRSVRKPTVAPQPDLPSSVWIKLLLDGIEREVDDRTRFDTRTGEYTARQLALKAIGADAAAAMRNRDKFIADCTAAADAAAREKATYDSAALKLRSIQHDQMTSARSAVDALWIELAEAIGMDPKSACSSPWVVRREIQRLQEQLHADARVQTMQTALADAIAALQRAAGLTDDKEAG